MFRQPSFSVDAVESRKTIDLARHRAERMVRVNSWLFLPVLGLCAVAANSIANYAMLFLLNGAQDPTFGDVGLLVFVGIVAFIALFSCLGQWVQFWRLAAARLQTIPLEDAAAALRLCNENPALERWRARIATEREIVVGDWQAMQAFDRECVLRAQREIERGRQEDAFRALHRRKSS